MKQTTHSARAVIFDRSKVQARLWEPRERKEMAPSTNTTSYHITQHDITWHHMIPGDVFLLALSTVKDIGCLTSQHT